MEQKEIIPDKEDNVPVGEIPQWFPWNGSKRWLVKHLIPVFSEWDGKGKYIVGGGSIATVVKSLFKTKQYPA